MEDGLFYLRNSAGEGLSYKELLKVNNSGDILNIELTVLQLHQNYVQLVSCLRTF